MDEAVEDEQYELLYRPTLPQWYCNHGYPRGEDCPDCSVPSHWPAVLTSDRVELD